MLSGLIASHLTELLIGAGVLLAGALAVRILLREVRGRAVAEDDLEEASGDAEKRSKVTDALGQRRTRSEWAARARRVLEQRKSRRD